MGFVDGGKKAVIVLWRKASELPRDIFRVLYINLQLTWTELSSFRPGGASSRRRMNPQATSKRHPASNPAHGGTLIEAKLGTRITGTRINQPVPLVAVTRKSGPDPNQKETPPDPNQPVLLPV